MAAYRRRIVVTLGGRRPYIIGGLLPILSPTNSAGLEVEG